MSVEFFWFLTDWLRARRGPSFQLLHVPGTSTLAATCLRPGAPCTCTPSSNVTPPSLWLQPRPLPDSCIQSSPNQSQPSSTSLSAIVESYSYRNHGCSRSSPPVPQPHCRPLVLGRPRNSCRCSRLNRRAVRQSWQCFQAEGCVEGPRQDGHQCRYCSKQRPHCVLFSRFVLVVSPLQASFGLLTLMLHRSKCAGLGALSYWIQAYPCPSSNQPRCHVCPMVAFRDQVCRGLR